MNRRKLLSILLSFALVFSMTTAFTFSVYADEAKDTAQNQDAIVPSYQASQIVTPDSIMINGQKLSVGQYYNGTRTTYIRPLNNYAYYKMDLSGKKRLVLHGLTLTGTEGNSAISVGSQSSGANTLYIDLEGESALGMAEGNKAATIDAGSCSLVISAKNNNSALKLKSNNGTYEIAEKEIEEEEIEEEEVPAEEEAPLLLGAPLGTEQDTQKDVIEPTHCISAGSFTLSGGKVKIMAGTGYYKSSDISDYTGDSAIFTSKGDVIISGGSLDIVSAAVGINSAACVYFTGGNTTIGQTGYSISGMGVYAPKYSIIINGGNLTINNAGKYGLKADNSIFVKKGQVSISNVGNSAISTSKNNISLTGGDIIIYGVNNGINTGNGNIIFGGSNVSLTDISGDAVYAFKDNGAMNGGGNICITGGNISIGDATKSTPDVKYQSLISEGSTTISGGSLTIKNVNLQGMTSKGGITINGGSITIDGAYKGIDLLESFEMNGGSLTISNIDYSGIEAYNRLNADKGKISLNGGTFTMENIGSYGIKSSSTIDIKGTTLSMKNIGEEGLKASNNISIDSSNFNMEKIGKSALTTPTNITIKDSSLALNTIGNHGILATNNIDINSSDLTLKSINKDPALRLAAIYAIGGSTTIKDTTITVDDAFDAIVSNLDISVENTRLSFDNLDNCGILSNSPVKINNSSLNIAKTQHGIYSLKNVDFSNSEGSITAFLYGIYGGTGVDIKDSDLEVLSTCEDANCKAFNPTASVYGSPAVYAGTSKYNAKRVAADTELGTYKYVHIYKNSNVVLTRISTAITDLFTAIFGTDSKLFGNSPLWKTLLNIINK